MPLARFSKRESCHRTSKFLCADIQDASAVLGDDPRLAAEHLIGMGAHLYSGPDE